MRRGLKRIIGALLASVCSSEAISQIRLDRADLTVIERSLDDQSRPELGTNNPLPVTVDSQRDSQVVQTPRIASAIIVEGAREISQASFSDVLLSYIGRSLGDQDLRDLASAVSTTARKAGFVFATARIDPQRMSDGILRVRLDLGEISAVRVIGKANLYADRILSHALVTGRAVRKRDLERAILLVQDIAGISVRETKYIRQDGFGILLVTTAADRASLYAQLDNRGSSEVGPIRSTLLGSFRGIAQAGDEFSFVAAQTPFAPSEFFFLRGRYAMPIDASGSMVSASAAFCKTRPGGILEPLNVIGESVDGAVDLATPLFRTRQHSVWASVEFRALESTQTLLGLPLRRDRMAVVTVTASGIMNKGRSSIRGELAMSTGLPVSGVSREGDPMISRRDGDARFVTLGYDLSWEMRATRRLSFAIASQGQIASRPLLASVEIGVGGTQFGRGYDYAERTGDNGILGSAEVRYDLGKIAPTLLDRATIYGSVDGGYVVNLRNGPGGGGLLSAASGLRLGHGAFDSSLEIALPINSQRFDTGDHQPRISVKIARSF